MENSRETCRAVVSKGPRKGLQCSLYAGLEDEHCFRHSKKEKIKILECGVCYETKEISWFLSCCKAIICKDCLMEYQNVKRTVTSCPMCQSPMNNRAILNRKPLPDVHILHFTSILFQGIYTPILSVDGDIQELLEDSIPPTNILLVRLIRKTNYVSPIGYEQLTNSRVEKHKRIFNPKHQLGKIIFTYQRFLVDGSLEDIDDLKVYGSPPSNEKFPYSNQTLSWGVRLGETYYYLLGDPQALYETITLFIARKEEKKWKFEVFNFDLLDSFLKNLYNEHRQVFFILRSDYVDTFGPSSD